MTSETDPATATEAVELFAEFLETHDPGDGTAFDELCTAHPHLAAELARLRANFHKLDGMFVEGASPAPDDASAAHPMVQLDGASAAVLERLRGRERPTQRYRATRPDAGEARDVGEAAELGRGGMGRVLRVWDVDIGRPLAMKVALSRDGGDAATRRVRRFLDEVQITGQLDHPGVVPVHELGIDDDGRLYFTMRVVEGRDLGAIFALARRELEGWNRARALSAVLRVCETMAFAHERGVIHRDLKPANVMVGGFGETYVMDWGLAKVVGSDEPRATADDAATRVRTAASESDTAILTQDGTVLGTPAYMSPEQAQGELGAMGPRSDVYSVGAMLYHLLAGHAPYLPAGATKATQAVLLELLDGPPDPLDLVARDVPAELAAMCERAMARDPALRYADMGEMADDLRAYLEGRVVRAYETGAVAELKKWFRRNRGMAASIAAAIALALGGLASTSLVQARSNAALARKNDELDTARTLAETERASAEAERRQVLRLADLERLEELEVQADLLYPPREELAPRMEAWLAQAQELVARAPQHERDLAELEAQALPEDASLPYDTPHDRDLAEARRRLDDANALLAKRRRVPSRVPIADYEGLVDRIADDVQELEDEVRGFRPYAFATKELQWQHRQLSRLVDELRAFGAAGGPLDEMRERLASALGVNELSISGAEAEARWNEAIGSIADPTECPRYEGLVVRPQVGLLPLARDARSGLWEFALVQTGAVPEVLANGEVAFRADSALVFVLLPGGSFWMGAERPESPAGSPNVDPYAQPYEGPPHVVTLAPFFLSKYELTQAQWQRFTGTNPSTGRPQQSEEVGFERYDWTTPVNNVTWFEAVEVLWRFGMVLPTEAQWEYAARAGTTTVYWTGDDPRSLEGTCNLADVTWMNVNPVAPDQNAERWMDDGRIGAASAGSYAPNPFGLYDLLGNVWELCLDDTCGYLVECWPDSGERIGGNPDFRIVRGGSFNTTAEALRSAARDNFAPDARALDVGLRPAVVLER